jgi:hypothetical protein
MFWLKLKKKIPSPTVFGRIVDLIFSWYMQITFHYIRYISWKQYGGVQQNSCRSYVSWLSVWILQPPMDPSYRHGALVDWRVAGKKEVLGKKHAFVPQWPPQTPYGLPCAWNKSSGDLKGNKIRRKYSRRGDCRLTRSGYSGKGVGEVFGRNGDKI